MSRRNLPAAAAILLAAMLFGSPMGALANSAVAPAADKSPSSEPAYAKWFKFSPTLRETWTFTDVADDPNIVHMVPKRFEDATSRKKILVLYPRPSSAYDVAISKILKVFDDKALDVELTAVNFETDDAKGKAALKRAQAGGYELILSMGSESTAWLWANYKDGKLPVVTVCSKDPVVLHQSRGYNRGSGTNFAFTSLNMPIDVQMAYVNELKPKLRNIAVLVDSKNVSAIETQAKPVADYARSRGVRVLEIAVQDPNNAKAELEKTVREATAQMSKNDPDLSNSVFWVTGSTAVFKEIATINANAGRAAVLSVVPEIVRGGDDSAVLSIGISFESNAHLAAVYAADVLRGRAAAGELKVGVVTPPDIAISFRKARDIGMMVPLSFFEAAGTIYDYDGKAVRVDGVSVVKVGN